MEQMDGYDVFIDKGEFHTGKIPKNFKKIKIHFIFAIEHDGRHKARLVADGHLTDVPLNSVYSGVVSLREWNGSICDRYWKCLPRSYNW